MGHYDISSLFLAKATCALLFRGGHENETDGIDWSLQDRQVSFLASHLRLKTPWFILILDANQSTGWLNVGNVGAWSYGGNRNKDHGNGQREHVFSCCVT